MLETQAMKKIIRKLAMLMVLVQASRSLEIAALDLSRQWSGQKGLTKKRSLKELFLGGLLEDERVYIIRCLRVYENITADHRGQVKKRRANCFSHMSSQIHCRGGSKRCSENLGWQKTSEEICRQK